MKKNLLYIVLATALSAFAMTACEDPVEPTPQPQVYKITVTTAEVTDVTNTTAKSGGEVTSDGTPEITERGVCWGTETAPTVEGSKTSDGKGLGKWTSSIEGLTPGSTYYVRAYAIYNEEVTYGNEVSFTAGIIAPTVTTAEVTEITHNTALSGGHVQQGDKEILEAGICWAKTENPTYEECDNLIEDLDENGDFVAEMIFLDASTTYYVRAFATTEDGTVYGNQVSFSTIVEPEVVMPDQTFKEYVLANYDSNSDGRITADEAALVTVIDLWDRCTVTSCEGIKEFPNLEKLNLQTLEEGMVAAGTRNAVATLDVSGLKSLKELWLANCSIVNLNVAGCSSLIQLHAGENQIETVDLTGCVSLEQCHMNNNKFTSIDFTDCENIINIGMIGNPITSLNVAGKQKLAGIWAQNSKITDLDASGSSIVELWGDNALFNNVNLANSNITRLYMDWAPVQTLNLDGCDKLTEVHALGNKLSALDLSDCTALAFLHLNDGELPELDLSGCPNLQDLGVINTKIATLNLAGNKSIRNVWMQNAKFTNVDFSDSSIFYIAAENNPFTSINVTGCTSLDELSVVLNPTLESVVGLETCTSLRNAWFWNSAVREINICSSKLNIVNADSAYELKSVKIDLQGHDAEWWAAVEIFNSAKVESIELTNCEKMWRLFAHTNIALQRVDGLENCNGVQEVFLDNTAISKLEVTSPRLALAKAPLCPNLTSVKVNASGSPHLVEVSVNESANLAQVELVGNTINKINVFNCPKMTRLDISGLADHFEWIWADWNPELTIVARRAQTYANITHCDPNTTNFKWEYVD